MKTFFASFLYLLFFISHGVDLSRADSSFPDAAFTTISSDISLGANPFPQVGDTVTLVLIFKPRVSCDATIRVGFAASVAPPDVGSELFRDSTFAVDSGVTYTYYMPLRIFGSAASNIEASVRTGSSGIELARESGFTTLQIEQSGGVFRVLGNVSRNDSSSYTCETIAGIELARMRVSGKIQYFNSVANAYQGAYGVWAVLVFRKHPSVGVGVPCDFGSTPTYFHPVAGWIEGKHYAKVDVNGNFSFDFLGPISNWSSYLDVSVLVTNWNDATLLMNDPDETTPTGGISTYTLTGSGYPGILSNCPPALTTFRRAYSWCSSLGSSSNLNFTDVVINLPPFEGGVLRYSQLCQEFDDVRFGFTPPRYWAIPVTSGAGATAHRAGTYDGKLRPSHVKYTKPEQGKTGSRAVVGHEYGHVYNFDAGLKLENNFMEGFADFHSFAATNWMVNEYDDPIWEWWDINPDRKWALNFHDQYPIKNGGGQIIGWIVFPGRWGSWGYSTNPKAGIGAYLWNLYDVWESTLWEADIPQMNGDNDDVGIPDDLIDALNTTASASADYDISEFNDLILSGQGSDVGASVQAIYDCMMAADPVSPNHPVYPNMKSVQVIDLDGISSTTPSLHYDLTWGLPAYSGSDVHRNLPSAIKVYQLDPIFGWTLRQSLAGTATSITITGGEPDFRVTAANSSGESSGIPQINVPVLKPTTEGDKAQQEGCTKLSISESAEELICTIENVNGQPVNLRLLDYAGHIVADVYHGTPTSNIILSVEKGKLVSGSYFLQMDSPCSSNLRQFNVLR